MATTTMTVGGSPVPIGDDGVFPASLNLNLGGYSSLSFRRRGFARGLPDPWLYKTVTLSIDGDVAFSGRIVDLEDSHTESGLTTTYLARDLWAEADRTAMTDSHTLTDSAAYNFRSDSPFYLPQRAGMTVGEILEDVLTMPDNAAFLNARGIGGYTSMSPPTLPSETLADLAGLTLMPVQEVRITGGKFFTSLATWLESVQPNHRLHIAGDGTIRVFNLRNVVEHVLTLGVCGGRVMPPTTRRSVSDCFTRVVIRGEPVNEAKMYTLRQGGLVENFGYGSVSNSTAKATWTPDAFEADREARSEGTCTCTDLLTVVLTSDPTGQEWDADRWDQVNGQGYIRLWSNSLPGLEQSVTRLIASNTAKAAGGTCTVTLDAPLPDLSYSRYTIYGVSSGLSYTWRRYKVADPDVWPRLTRKFSVPQNHIGVNGDSVTKTSFPVGTVCWSATGNPPWNEFILFIHTIDNETGDVIFVGPTYNVAGGPPDDVRVLLAVNTGTLTAAAPAAGHEGTAYDVEGVEETWLVTMPDWRDPANQSNMEAYAQELLDSVKDAAVEGTVVVHDVFKPALAFGIGISIESPDYETGWEGLNVPVTAVTLTWNNGAGSHYTTTLSASNRLRPLSESNFLKPERQPNNFMSFRSGAGAINPWAPAGREGGR